MHHTSCIRTNKDADFSILEASHGFMLILYIQDSIVWTDGVVHGGIREECAQVVNNFCASVNVVCVDSCLWNVRGHLDGGRNNKVEIGVGTRNSSCCELHVQ